MRPILYVKSHGKHCQINDAKPLIVFRIGCIFFGRKRYGKQRYTFVEGIENK